MEKFVYCIGDVNWDALVALDNMPDEETQIITNVTWTPGGEAQNTARKLWERKFPVKLVGAIGEDELGDKLLEISPFAEFMRVKKKTGLTIAFIFKDGSRSFITDRGANEDLDPNIINKEDLKNASFVFKGGYWHNKKFREKDGDLKLFRIAKEMNKPTGLNLGWNYEGWKEGQREKLFKVLEYVDYLFLNENELRDLTGEEDLGRAMDYASQYTNLVIHLGEEGCIFKSNKIEANVPVDPIIPMNPVGAGDAFNAGFIMEFLKTGDPIKACKMGNILGREHVSKPPINYMTRSVFK